LHHVARKNINQYTNI